MTQRMTLAFVLFLAAFLASDRAAAESAETVFGAPVHQPHAEILWTRVLSDDGGRYIGWPTVLSRRDGEVIAVYSGDREAHICPWGQVRIVRSQDGGETWSKPATLRNGLLDDRDSGIIELANGDLLAFWFTGVAFMHPSIVKRHPDWGRHFRKMPKEQVCAELGSFSMLSTDSGKTWTRPVRVPTSAPHGGIQLKDGRILVVGVQSAATRGEFPEKEPHRAGKLDARHVIAESTDGGRSWRERLMYPDGAWKSCGACEPHLIEARDGTLRCLFRWQEGAAHLLQAESHDGGRTWSVPKETTVDGYPPHLLRLADGRILLTYARRKKDDYGEFAAVSSDDGCTWQACGEIKLASGGEQDLGYPSSCQLEDGSILTVYYQRAKPEAPHSLMGTKWRIR